MATNNERIAKLESEVAGKERVAILESKVDDLKKDICEVKENNSIEHKEIKQIIQEFIIAADKKYSTKDEVNNVKSNLKAMWALVVGVLAIAVGVLIYINQAFIQHLNK